VTYRIVWGVSAESMPAEIWLGSGDRTSVTEAAAALEAALPQRPLRIGESRTSSVHRVAYEPPLGIEYEVVEDDKKVIVQGVFSLE
jgi:hypothetical protein